IHRICRGWSFDISSASQPQDLADSIHHIIGWHSLEREQRLYSLRAIPRVDERYHVGVARSLCLEKNARVPSLGKVIGVGAAVNFAHGAGCNCAGLWLSMGMECAPHYLRPREAAGSG